MPPIAELVTLSMPKAPTHGLPRAVPAAHPDAGPVCSGRTECLFTPTLPYLPTSRYCQLDVCQEALDWLRGNDENACRLHGKPRLPVKTRAGHRVTKWTVR